MQFFKYPWWLGMVVIGLALVLLGLARPVAAQTPFNPPDYDGDGLADELESAGWYNLQGGPYITDPYDADTDDDGLSDGEEKLFGTIPVNGPADLVGTYSPGIFIRYDPAFKTRQYFSPVNEMEEDEWGNPIRKYLPVLQGGEKLLMTEAMVVRRGTTIHIGGPQAYSATLTITGTGMSPSSLTPVRDENFQSTWAVTFPANGSVGTYTATMALGSWSKRIPIYVIFEFPGNLSEAQIAAYIYDDDPANLRDEVSVWWRAPQGWEYYIYYDPTRELTTPHPTGYCDGYPNRACSDWEYHHSSAYAQAFWTEQFTQKVFVRHTMPAIRGQTVTTSTVTAIANWADKEFRTVYFRTHNNWSDAMRKYNKVISGTTYLGYMDGGACQDNANVLVALLRAAGLPAKTFIGDYSHTPNQHGESGRTDMYEYDHSVLVWLSGAWKGVRSYNGNEESDMEYPYNHGIKGVSGLYNWYSDNIMDQILTSDHRWDWQNGSDGGGMVNTVWDGTVEGIPSEEFRAGNLNWDIDWNSRRPLETKQSPYTIVLNKETWYGDAWAPSEWRNPPVSNPAGRTLVTQTYALPTGVPSPTNPIENWPLNPIPVECSPSSVGTPDCQAMLGGGQGLLRLLETSGTAPALSSAEPVASIATGEEGQVRTTPVPAAAIPQLGRILRDYGVDYDGNGRWDALVVEVEVTVAPAGQYQLGGWLQVGNRSVPARNDLVFLNSQYLVKKLQTVSFVFDGQAIGLARQAGPYQVTALWLAAPEQPVVTGLPEETLAYQAVTYKTQSYAAQAFEGVAATISGKYEARGVDGDGDGRYESLELAVPLQLNTPGLYRLAGDLYDGARQLVAQAAWEGKTADAVLRFAISGSQPPYTVEHLRLVDVASGAILDSRHFRAYTVETLDRPVSQGPVALALPTPVLSLNGVALKSVRPTQVFTLTAVDTNGNGKYDALQIRAGVTVSETAGSYRIEGALVDAAGRPVAWSVSAPQALDLGAQELTLSFDGRALYDALLLSPATQTFQLVAVKIFSGTLSQSTLEDAVAVAITTPAYTRDDFEPSSGLAHRLVEDDVEGGTDYWSWSAPLWGVTNTVRYNGAQAWQARATSTVSGSLALTLTQALDLAGYVHPALRFRTAYKLPTNSVARVEVSANGGAWTPVATYTGTVPHWATVQLPLGSLSGASAVRFRFNVEARNGTAWYVDDIHFNAWPAITAASFTYTPTSVLVGEPVTFVASYTSVDRSLPITYTWDFGDGTPVVVTDSPTVTHSFGGSVVDYAVQLTVANPQDHMTYMKFIGVHEPVLGAAFTYTPTTAFSDWAARFTATYTPSSATQPVTFTWDFGDGSSPVATTAAVVTHTFPTTGTYPLTLTTYNGYGLPVMVTGVITAPLDNDGDGLSNAAEQTWGTDPYDPDYDDDGLTDGEEVNQRHTDPINPDSDGDTLTDGAEVNQYGTNPNNVDTDGDTINDNVEIANGTDPLGNDTDHDGLEDGDEATWGTDPHVQDSDGDGLWDGEEVHIYYTQPMDSDTDDDNLSDGAEVHAVPASDPLLPDTDGDNLRDDAELAAGTDPTNPDSDGDGMPDGWEVAHNLNPLVHDALADPDEDDLTNLAEYQQQTDPHDNDTDNDGMPDGWEVQHALNPLVNDAADDPDTDGLTNLAEYNRRTDPRNADSDGDGLTDGDEVTRTTDPLDADTDDDGLTDGAEVNTHHTNPLLRDSDGDSIWDGDEVRIGTSPNDTDSDDDNIDDGVEIADPNHPLDADGDGIPDALETDSDADGILDSIETVADFDGDGLSNYRDTDADADGLPDAVEGTADRDGDSRPDYLDPNYNPTGLGLTPLTVAENQPPFTAVGVFTTADLDVADVHTYTLVAGAGSAGNDQFTIAGAQLQTAVSFDYEVQSSYTVRVRTTDTYGDFYEQVFTVTILDANDAPLAQDDAVTVDEGGSISGNLLSNDSDPEGQPLAVTLTPVVSPTHGTVVLSASGIFTYTHDGSETTNDSFTYEVCDNGTPVQCGTAVVRITVTTSNHFIYIPLILRNR